jgi:hypothetical protein
MLLGHSSGVLQSGSGLSFDGTVDTSLAFLKDGRPGALCEVTASGSQDLFISWASPIQAQVGALINVSYAVGTSITATLKVSGGSYSTQAQTRQVVETASGDKCVFFNWDVANVDGVKFTLPNGTATIGEAWLSPALDNCIRSSWQSGAGEIGQDVSIAGSLYVTPAVPRRVVVAEFAPRPYDTDFESFRAAQLAISGDPRVLIIPDDADQGGIDSTGMYARATSIGSLEGSAQGRHFSFGITAEEMPGRLP